MNGSNQRSGMCEQIYYHIQAFVQGFVLGKMLCTCPVWTNKCQTVAHQRTSYEECTEDSVQENRLTERESSIKSEVTRRDGSTPPPSCTTPSASSQDLSVVAEPGYGVSSTSVGGFQSSSSLMVQKRTGSVWTVDKQSLKSKTTKSLKSPRRIRNPGVAVTEKGVSAVTCGECGMEFSGIMHLKQHIRRYHNRRMMACRICGKLFSGQRGLSIHMQIKHAGEKPAECDICGQRFYSSDECSRHQSRDHGKERGICHICGKHFRSRHSLNDHIKVHMGIKGYVCEHCGKSFLRYTALWSHKKYLHSCKMCAKELVSGQCPAHPTMTQIKEHSLHNDGVVNLLQCVECQETLESIEAMEVHKKSHEQQRPFHCQICGKGYHTSSSLYSHRKQHQEKQFQCDLCDKTFTYKCNMKKHRETHLEGQPYQCDQCNKTFRMKDNLEKHRTTHREKKRYKCHICGKGLTRLQHLKSHLRKMHPDS